MTTPTPRAGSAAAPKAPARKPAARKSADAATVALPAATDPVVVAPVDAPPAPAPHAAPAAPPAPPARPASASVLERLRRNRMGAVLGGLVVSLALGLLLSLIVPDTQVLLALIIFGMAEAVAVGFTVRYLTDWRGLSTQLTAAGTAAIGVHVLATTGVIYQSFGDLGELMQGLFGGRGDQGTGLGFDDALLAGLWTPTVSTGAIIVGLVAAIIAGWGPREGARD